MGVISKVLVPSGAEILLMKSFTHKALTGVAQLVGHRPTK